MALSVWLPALGLAAAGIVALVVAAVGVRRSPESEAAIVSVDEPASEAVRQWLLAALDEHDDAVVVVDRIGREVVRNRAARRHAEARTGELLADPALTELLAGALEGSAVEDELRVFGPPGRVLRLQARPIRRGDEVVGAVGFVRDVSETHRLDAIRRDFVANVSHELKTPIGALALLAETIATTDDPTEIRRLAERIDLESERIGRLVDDLLDLGRAEVGDRTRREPRTAAALIADAVDAVGSSSAAAGVAVVTAADLAADVSIECDVRQVHSALVNLLDNAIKYSERGSEVAISASVDDGGRVAITVRDRGIGIPARSLERIFERFYRVDRARSRETGGTGLGLAIVRHVAQAHGGEVSVTSTEGEGSTFVLVLPSAVGADR
ncbi:MAG: sensor histidine kinase [Actinomycetota bacterium]